ncbi:unnamed protein product [Cylicocyclus nassatus]|uniref:Protection of telomeres protein 1 ssDNA-binding domain-containing protein n=1 Tax=Cylicocyclus nassatus TaxID=53992 RepID=A0AA36GK95_CYLNA|nr:unnamed protein product [Cylicocyclus nassatus]
MEPYIPRLCLELYHSRNLRHHPFVPFVLSLNKLLHHLDFYLNYFDFLAQVVSLRVAVANNGATRLHILRVWDGHESIKRQDYDASWIISLNVENYVIPSADQFTSIPKSYFFDIILYGEWIRRAASLKSGAIVVLRNLHFYLRAGYSCPVLVLHEGDKFGRGIIEITPEIASNHYRCVKLNSDLNEVLKDHQGVPTITVDENLVEIESDDSVQIIEDEDSVEVVELTSHRELSICADVTEQLREDPEKHSPVLLSQNGSRTYETSKRKSTGINHGQENISPERFAALAEIFYRRHH